MAKAGLLFVGTDDGLVMFSDPGASGRWLRVGHELRGEQVLAVWPLFERPQIVLAGGPGGLWRTDSGGASWNKLADEHVVMFAGEKTTPDVVELRAADGTTWHSDTGGATWHRQPAGQTAALAAEPAQAILPGQSPVLLAVREHGIARSEDNGATWTPAAIDEPWSGAITVLVPARYHIDTAYAGTEGGQVASSSDRGRHWQVLKRDLSPVRVIVATRLA